MNNSPDLSENNQLDQFLDLPSQLRGPARVHGRAMVALVYGAGMASEATKVLVLRAQSQRDSAGMHALRVLADVYNQTSTALCRSHGWTEEMLAMCDRDISQSFAGGIQVADKKIILT